MFKELEHYYSSFIACKAITQQAYTHGVRKTKQKKKKRRRKHKHNKNKEGSQLPTYYSSAETEEKNGL